MWAILVQSAHLSFRQPSIHNQSLERFYLWWRVRARAVPSNFYIDMWAIFVQSAYSVEILYLRWRVRARAAPGLRSLGLNGPRAPACHWFVCVLQCVAVCCSVLQCVVVCCSVLQCVAVCCSMLQCVAVCCVLSGVGHVADCMCVAVCVAVCCSVLHRVTPWVELAMSLLRMCVAVCIAVCCSVLQCVAVCCSVLQCGLQCVTSWVKMPHAPACI